MSVELPDSYQAIYQRAIQQMGVGESQEAIDSLLRIVKRLSRLRPETLQRKPNLQQTLYGSWNAVTQFLSWENRHQEAIDLTTERDGPSARSRHRRDAHRIADHRERAGRRRAGRLDPDRPRARRLCGVVRPGLRVQGPRSTRRGHRRLPQSALASGNQQRRSSRRQSGPL